MAKNRGARSPLAKKADCRFVINDKSIIGKGAFLSLSEVCFLSSLYVSTYLYYLLYLFYDNYVIKKYKKYI